MGQQVKVDVCIHANPATLCDVEDYVQSRLRRKLSTRLMDVIIPKTPGSIDYHGLSPRHPAQVTISSEASCIYICYGGTEEQLIAKSIDLWSDYANVTGFDVNLRCYVGGAQCTCVNFT